VVVVPNYDTCACAGTHLKTTGEIGQIKIIKRESYKGGVRLTALYSRTEYGLAMRKAFSSLETAAVTETMISYYSKQKIMNNLPIRLAYHLKIRICLKQCVVLSPMLVITMAHYDK